MFIVTLVCTLILAVPNCSHWHTLVTPCSTAFGSYHSTLGFNEVNILYFPQEWDHDLRMCVCVCVSGFLHLIVNSSSHAANNDISSSVWPNDISLCIYVTYSLSIPLLLEHLVWALDVGCGEQCFNKHESVEDTSLTHQSQFLWIYTQ